MSKIDTLPVKVNEQGYWAKHNNRLNRRLYAQLDQPQKVCFEINAVEVHGLLLIQENEWEKYWIKLTYNIHILYS